MLDTIAAITTGQMNNAISIIRISGSDAFTIINKIFKGKKGEHKTVTFGSIMDGDKLLDEVLVL